MALSETCYPEIALGALPHLYPFIVNDPGEGTQAKRRSGAVIVDHLTPPLTRAESYGPLRDLERLVDEYYEASALDPARLPHLARTILDQADAAGFAGRLRHPRPTTTVPAALDQARRISVRPQRASDPRRAAPCFGVAPDGRLLLHDLLAALVRHAARHRFPRASRCHAPWRAHLGLGVRTAGLRPRRAVDRAASRRGWTGRRSVAHARATPSSGSSRAVAAAPDRTARRPIRRGPRRARCSTR